LLLFIDAFGELTDKITRPINNVCISYSLLYLCCKFHNILNDCQDIVNLLYGYLNLAHPVIITVNTAHPYAHFYSINPITSGNNCSHVLVLKARHIGAFVHSNKKASVTYLGNYCIVTVSIQPKLQLTFKVHTNNFSINKKYVLWNAASVPLPHFTQDCLS